MHNDQSQTLTAAEIDKDNPTSLQSVVHQALPLAAVNSTKRFSASSVNVNKRFLNKATPSTLPNLVSKQPIAVAVQKPSSPASRVKLLTGKRNPTSPSLSHKQLSDSTKDSASQLDGSHGLSSGSMEDESSKAAAAANKVWGARSTTVASSIGGKPSQIGIRDFPTAAEAARGPPPPINYNEAIDSAFAGVRSKHDSHNTGWDEMMDDSLDFSSDVLEFGDGIQYKVSSHSEQITDKEPTEATEVFKSHVDHIEVPVSKEERFPQNYDRSWRPPLLAQANSPPSHEDSVNQVNRKVIYDERRDKFSSVSQSPFDKSKVPSRKAEMQQSVEAVRLLHKEPPITPEAEKQAGKMDANGPTPVDNSTSPTISEQPSLPQTHDAQRQAMLEAAERARKRRQEEEGARQQEAERARLKASLLAGVGAEKSRKFGTSPTSPPTTGAERSHKISTSPPTVAAVQPELMRRPPIIPRMAESSSAVSPTLPHRFSGPPQSMSQIMTERPANIHHIPPKASPTISYRPIASRPLDYIVEETSTTSYPMDAAHSRPLLSPALPLSPRAVHVKLPRKADAKDHSSFDDVMSRIKGALGDGFAAQARTHADDDGVKSKESPEETPILVKLGPTVGSLPEQSQVVNERSAPTKRAVDAGMPANKMDHLIFVPVRHSAESDRLQVSSIGLFEVLRSLKTPVRIPRLRKKSHGRTFYSRYAGMDSTWVDKMFGRLPFAPISREELADVYGNGTTIKLPVGNRTPEQQNSSVQQHLSTKKFDRNNAARRGHHKAAFSQRGHSEHANHWRAGSLQGKDKAVASAATQKDSSS